MSGCSLCTPNPLPSPYPANASRITTGASSAASTRVPDRFQPTTLHYCARPRPLRSPREVRAALEAPTQGWHVASTNARPVAACHNAPPGKAPGTLGSDPAHGSVFILLQGRQGTSRGAILGSGAVTRGPADTPHPRKRQIGFSFITSASASSTYRPTMFRYKFDVHRLNVNKNFQKTAFRQKTEFLGESGG